MIKEKVIFIFIFLFVAACDFPSGSSEDNDNDRIHDENCFVENITELPKWKQFSDSMLRCEFSYFRVHYEHSYGNPESRCKKYHQYNMKSFIIKYERKNRNLKISEDSITKLRFKISKVLFTHYLSDSVIMANSNFVFEDELILVPVLQRQAILDSCAFEIKQLGKNKYRRIFK